MGRLILTGSSRCGTTITRHILSEHPDIYLTNELRLYWRTLLNKDPNIYFNYIKKMMVKGNNYSKLPKNFSKKLFNEICSSFKDDTILNRILSAEKGIFMNPPRYFGDKGVNLSVLDRFFEINLDFKLIFIYRDGRDVAYSGFRQLKDRTEPPWSNDMPKNALHWAKKINGLLKRQEKNNWLAIKFEDYIENPDKNINKVADYLEIDSAPLFMARDRFINNKTSHIGYYKKGWPNWQTECPQQAINVLKKLGYL